MADWFDDRIIDPGRMPLLCFFAGMVVGFLFIRVSVRLIRANVRWWPGNVTPGGRHVHHMVFGLGFMVVGGVSGLAVPDELVGWTSAAAALFGVGTALVIDEFALILHLDDVYWSEEGRISVDAMFGLIAVTAMLLLGMHPFFGFEPDSEASGVWQVWPLLIGLGLAVVTVLKGKVWTAVFGMFILLPLLFGAIRLARPQSPWSRWRYRSDRPRGVRKLNRARRREHRLRRPVNQAKNRLQDLVAGSLHR
ncbi:hypothetical protein L0U85_08105 [Glycomyces sp. L485]|uniref:hypothetical protein n=1 Tax=Glycomyces sp. L485 TaxID=2909235 RepID=UPI001F4A90E0|nr:hypothetical protein [Glycomyces sp. L485]MCH7230811.1 hypothetical protein [Glycomyces sp. L485]